MTYFPAGNAANNQDLRVRTLAVGNDYGAIVLPDGHALFSGGVFTRGGNGDFNGDGVLAPGDALGVINYVNGVTGLPTPEQYARADINGDGRLSAIDSELITEVLNGTLTLAQARTTGKTVSDRAFGLDIDGNVGIGVGDPASGLHLRASSSAAVPTMILEDPDAADPVGADPYISFRTSNGTQIGFVGDGSSTGNIMALVCQTGETRLSTVAAQPITFRTNDVEQMRLEAGGGLFVFGGNGDVSGDGTIVPQDANILNSYLNGERFLTASEYARADVNGDGQVTSVDRLELVRRLNISNPAPAFTANDHLAIKRINDRTIQPDLSFNVAIGQGPAASYTSPANNVTTGNIDVNDVFIRSTGQWASQGGGGPTFIAPVIVYNSRNAIDWTTFDASAVIPAGATAVILDYEGIISFTAATNNTFIRVRTDAASANAYILARVYLNDHRLGWGGQGVFPITAARTFQFQVWPEGFGGNNPPAGEPALGCIIRIIGYYD